MSKDLLGNVAPGNGKTNSKDLDIDDDAFL